ncbi:hypothetical protein EWM64_g5553 [Hericium alpestre]|uniref:Uncharacterized protein n=1 Tax=Hericium alpestre TaxID=135208 RepID=A0A4Y9ZV55_9AGAM|nr:hypothetical protein EWM64_g5553 [Hericium alpestre]
MPNQRYLAYLPHSGFHNQRIAFENALVLARILNRTLLVPPVRLGNQPIRYVHFDHLHRFLSLSGKDGLMHCSQVSQDVALPQECLDFFSFTHVSWQWLVNLSSVEAEQRLVYQADFTYPWLDPTSALENDTLILRDNGTYDYRFVDYDLPPAMQHHKYTSLVPISTLSSSDAPIIQLGTLFGSSRLHLRNRTNVAIRTRIRERMTLSNPILFDVAEVAKAALGKLYLGAHVRVGDGSFKDFGPRNARLKLMLSSDFFTLHGNPPRNSGSTSPPCEHLTPPSHLFRHTFI